MEAAHYLKRKYDYFGYTIAYEPFGIFFDKIFYSYKSQFNEIVYYSEFHT